MKLGNILNLAAVAIPFAAAAFGGSAASSAAAKTSSTASSAVSAGSFLQQGAQAFLNTTGAGESRQPFSYVQAERPRSVAELTRGDPTPSFSASAVSTHPLVTNANVQTVMANLAQNARNQQLRSMLQAYTVQPTIMARGARTQVGRSTLT